MVVEAAAGLTDDQAAVYDRQLRVWGLEVQKRLNEARVLIIGADGLAAEVAKNIVLAGVGHVTMLSDATSAVGADSGNFLVTTDTDPSMSAAEASARTLQAMNPFITVAGETSGSSSVSAATAGKYDLVVASGVSLAEVARLDDACTAACTAAAELQVQEGPQQQQQQQQLRRPGLFAGAVRGPYAFFFCNLHSHTYSEKDKPGQVTVTYPSFREAVAVPAAQLPKLVHPLYPVLKACAEFELAHGSPAPAGPSDVPALLQRASAEAASGAAAGGASFHPSALPREDMLASFVADTQPLAPVSAVVGGVLANNVVRAISHVGAPLRNIFLFGMHDNNGMIEVMPPGS